MVGGKRCFLILGVVLLLASSHRAFAFDHSHKPWTRILERYLVKGSFRYGELKKAQDTGEDSSFRDYIRELEGVTFAEYSAFSRAEQMAFLINAYNALTIKLILEHYPVKTIRDIGGFFKSPWSTEYFSLLGGKIRSLDPIEHDYLRPLYKDYRIHAAVNCASKSCPELRSEAFHAESLEEQLDDQMSKWLQDQSRNRVDISSQIVYISKIFDWYGKDFDQWGGGVSTVLVKHAAKIYKSYLDKGYRVRYLDYDWTLNE